MISHSALYCILGRGSMLRTCQKGLGFSSLLFSLTLLQMSKGREEVVQEKGWNLWMELCGVIKGAAGEYGSRELTLRLLDSLCRSYIIGCA